MPAPVKVKDLVNRFQEYLEAYKSGKYNETQVRREFIDPFFKALGWDIDNEQGAAEAYKDVIHEATVKVGGATKAPDYCFRIGGTRKFFLEAKKPSINIKDDPHPAFQLRRYAWSAKLQLSIVTDFEEFAVYDCRTRPTKSDKPSKERVMYFTFDEYIDRWDEIAGIFSLDAIRKGSFDNYVESNKKKRGTAEVDAVFLDEIEAWRESLAKNLALRNTVLSQRELNYTVQATIDRIIFLRICEDRGIEDYGRLMALQNGDNIYQRLCELFRQADDRYNSGLFHFQEEKDRPGTPDGLTLTLNIDDKVLKGIFKHLYYPDSPYEFSVLPADILGQVYEQFLGKVIRLTDKHRAIIEEKPEVKKAGGVYYTPTYIVDYIVKHTVGKLLEGKTARQAANIKILDPACGSGSFLIGAYQYLLDWHRDWYINDGPEKHSKLLYQGQGGEWRLSTDERKRILLKNIYGVDIDSQAVEVTKLSLLLKVLEGETSDTLNKQMALFHARALPDLRDNIKCGNSLISPDIYQQQQIGLLDNGEHYRINAFDWQAEFPEIFKSKSGGFDAVIGNPPYLNVDDTWGRKDQRLEALKKQYPHIYNDKTDILFYFLGKSIKLSKGFVSFIVSRAFLEAYKADKLRNFLLQNAALREIIDFRNFYVFTGVGITTCIINIQLHVKPSALNVYQLLSNKLWPFDIEKLLPNTDIFEKIRVPQNTLSAAPWSFVSEVKVQINKKIDKHGIALGKILAIGQGMQTGRNNVFGKRTEQEIAKWRLKNGWFFKRASNSDISRYTIRNREEYLLFLEDVSHFKKLSNELQRYLRSHSTELKSRAAYKRGDCEWWRYTWPLHKEWYDRLKILCPYLATNNRFALDINKEYIGLTDTTVLFDNGQPENLRYLLGLLNSKLLTFRFRSIGKLKSGDILEYFWNSISKLPIRRINLSERKEKEQHDDMVALVEQMLSLNKQLESVRTDHDKNIIQRQIDSADRQIDQLVYELYGLTDEEIKIVEESIAN